jgi:hypothetical protein
LAKQNAFDCITGCTKLALNGIKIALQVALQVALIGITDCVMLALEFISITVYILWDND